MKLLEILQKELTEFPEGMLYAVQDDDGEVKFGTHSHPALGESGIWQRREDGKNLTIPRLELAEDWDSAIVTKDMWENTRRKQIIVNVSGLTIEEKQCVNEALAKITGATKMPVINSSSWWFFAPSSSGSMVVTWDTPSSHKAPTHTPQQVLEMAEMETSTDQHIAQVDKFTITDSSGRIIFDGSLPSSGFSVKTDENGVAIMAAKHKVREDFNPKQPISVDVSNCTVEEKKEVQKAFFDVGIKWESSGAKFQYLDDVIYTNSTSTGICYGHLMYGTLPRTDSISHRQFLSMVYEPEQQGHVHADLAAQYASIAATVEDPWNYFEIFHRFDGKEAWITLQEGQFFKEDSKYRRKPKTHIVNGVEVPDLRIKLEEGDRFYLVDPTEPEFTFIYMSTNDSLETMWAERGLCYEPTEEGKQAAILHAKAWLGIA